MCCYDPDESPPLSPPAAAAPTSFEGPFGKIIYRVRAVIDTPRFSKDHKAHKPFYLLNLLDLNDVPDIEVSLMISQLGGAGTGGGVRLAFCSRWSTAEQNVIHHLLPRSRSAIIGF